MHCYIENVAYGCLFCSTGREKAIAAELEKRYSGIETLVPLKTRYWRHHGEAREEQIVLFPSYIFFRAQRNFDVFCLMRHNDIYLILRSDENDWRLAGNDRIMIERLFETNGVIGLSKAYFEGDKIRIVDGYLKAYEGQIIRVNRRAKTVQIKTQLQEKQILLWFGYEEVDSIAECRGGHMF